MEEVQGIILSGHNLMLTGQAGTGKTTLIKHAITSLTQADKKVCIVCPTGIAATQFVNYGGTTVHRWAGLFDGRYSNAEFAHKFVRDDSFNTARQNVASVDVLIIDEISMLSLKDFQQLEIACRLGRRNGDMLFGGIQVIACGDLFQLRPVGNQYFPDSRRYCFESDIWDRLFPHHYKLKTVRRTSEHMLIRAVQESATGNISKESNIFLSSLSRPIQESSSTVSLFATNFQADVYNAERLKKHPGEARMYVSSDLGKTPSLKKITAPAKLPLKIGAPVTLLKNLSNRLVNGVCGYIREMRDEEVDVYFGTLESTHTIQKFTFTVFDYQERRSVASRRQLPLRLGYGMTIHKAQGMTIESVKVHCANITTPGQLSVAIGRVRSEDGLQLVQYDKRIILPHPPEVYRADARETLTLQQNRGCCEQYFVPDMDTDYSQESSEGEEDSSGESTQSNKDDQPNELLDMEGTTSTDLTRDIFGFLFIPAVNVTTKYQQEYNNVVSSLAGTSYAGEWMATEKKKIVDHIKKYHPEFPTCTKNAMWNAFCGEFYKYTVSSDFSTTLIHLFNVDSVGDVTAVQRHVAVDAVLKCRDILLANAVPNDQPADQVKHVKTIPEIGKAKIRDVAGMCVSRARAKLMAIVSRQLHKDTAEASMKVNESNKRIEYIRSLVMPFSTEITDGMQVLLDKKQKGDAVTVVTESCFTYFQLLTNKVKTELTLDKLNIHKENLLKHVRETALSSSDLNECWGEALPMADPVERREIQEILTSTYIKVFGKQFRKDTKDKLKVIKTKALRKHIVNQAVASCSSSSSSSIQTTQDNVRAKLVVALGRDGGILLRRIFVKKDIVELCQAFGITTKTSWTKAVLIKQLMESLKQNQQIINPGMISENVLIAIGAQRSQSYDGNSSGKGKSTGTGKGKSTGKGKGKGRQVKEKYLCTVCNEEYIEDEVDWVQCDKCEGWVDRTCASLEEEEEWEEACIREVGFVCRICLDM